MGPAETGDQTLVTPIPGFEREKEKHAYVIFLSGPLMGKIHLLEEKTVVFGRSADADIPVNDLGISRHHASITYKRGKAILRDMGSTNGTWLDGRRIEEAELRDGNQIQISSSTILKYAYQDKDENIFHNELYRMAVVDALTGAYNKRYFEERIREEFSFCIRNSLPLSLLMLDIDHFKSINDTYGHQAGDYVLSQLSLRAKSITRNEDILARYGGEEFTVILKTTPADGALMFAERLRSLVDETPFDFEGQNVHVTISIGIATLSNQNFSTWEAMLRLADTLLYQSKNGGRNRVTSA